jgi:hypothetical protein
MLREYHKQILVTILLIKVYISIIKSLSENKL